MDTSNLAALVPNLMARHPACGWTALSGRSGAEDLVIELYPLGSPDRVATVRVNVGAEVFSFTFASHTGHDFTYEDHDRPKILRERIELAVQAITGPTRIILEEAGGTLVKSTMILNPDRLDSREDIVSYPARRLKSLLQGHRVTRKTADFPSTSDS